MTGYYVGLMSGTSMDGIDAVVASFESRSVQLHASLSNPYPNDLQEALLAAIRRPLSESLDDSGELHRRVGAAFRDAAISVIAKSGVNTSLIRAIGSHGQTLRHQPDSSPPLSLQVGDADIIASGTGITTIANFRQADLAVGGQGAPLVPPFHEWLFASRGETRVVANIGGIANITILPAAGGATTGFDTGPGNGLMDAWSRRHLDASFDDDGKWAACGSQLDELLELMLSDPYFSLPPPKSTGFEYFNPEWLARFDLEGFVPADVQATLCELTTRSIGNSIENYAGDMQELFVCGGGAKNSELMRRLERAVPGKVSTTARAGLDPDWVEAAAFAWLAMRTLRGESGNLPAVTGASHKVVLGEIHSP